MALPTLIDEERHDVVAFLAPCRPCSAIPALVVAFVILPQGSHDGLEPVLPISFPCLLLPKPLLSLPPGRFHAGGFLPVGMVAGVDLGGPLVQAVLIPLLALAGSPFGSAYVAELEPAPATLYNFESQLEFHAG
jgi:hypothetical protein